jgi:hypothetical protein
VRKGSRDGGGERKESERKGSVVNEEEEDEDEAVYQTKTFFIRLMKFSLCSMFQKTIISINFLVFSFNFSLARGWPALF